MNPHPVLELIENLDFESEESLKKVLFVFKQSVVPYKESKSLIENIKIKRKYSLLREIILGFHWLIEYRLDSLIESRIDVLIGAEQNMRQYISENFSFREKMKLCNLLLIKGLNFKMLKKIAQVRDCFAHNIPLNDKRYLLNGKHIVLNGSCTKEFLKKISVIASEISNIFVKFRNIVTKSS